MMIELPELPRVTQDFMNNDHDHAAEILSTLLKSLELGEETAITDGLIRFQEHNREHFAREEAEMIRINFPPYGCHKGEHERVLAELAEEIEQWNAKKDTARLEHYLQTTVTQWLVNHINTMDTVTAMFISNHNAA